MVKLDQQRPIASLLEAAGLTHAELAERMGVGRVQVSKAVERRSRISLTWLKRAVEASGMMMEIKIMAEHDDSCRVVLPTSRGEVALNAVETARAHLISWEKALKSDPGDAHARGAVDALNEIVTCYLNGLSMIGLGDDDE